MTIDLKPYVSKLKNTSEEQRFNHDKCPAGHDSRQRLYIKRLDSNALIGYCHNCGENGVLSAKGRTLSRHESIAKVVDEAATTGFVLPSDLVSLASIPATQHPWPYLYKYDFYQDNVDYLMYSKTLDRIAYPIFGNYDSLMDKTGYVLRYLGDNVSEPKVLNCRVSQDEYPMNSWLYCGSNTPTLIIVEDYLSGKRLYTSTTNKDILVLNGTHLAKENLVRIANNYQTVILYLDPDEAGYKAANKIQEEFVLMNPRIINITGNHPQAKRLSVTQVTNQIDIYG